MRGPPRRGAAFCPARSTRRRSAAVKMDVSACARASRVRLARASASVVASRAAVSFRAACRRSTWLRSCSAYTPNPSARMAAAAAASQPVDRPCPVTHDLPCLLRVGDAVAHRNSRSGRRRSVRRDRRPGLSRPARGAEGQPEARRRGRRGPATRATRGGRGTALGPQGRRQARPQSPGARTRATSRVRVRRARRTGDRPLTSSCLALPRVR